jgi:pimeloyl-ACP methyl ester carboxylesterase
MCRTQFGLRLDTALLKGRMQMERIDVAGIALDMDIQGAGPPLLYLHPEHYRQLHDPFKAKLAERWTVHAPRHPGFDGRQPPGTFRRIDDLAYLYLDLLEQLDLKEVTLLGASFGGWIGLEMAVRSCSRLRALGLFAPLGVKLGGRGDRDFADLSALPDDEAARCLFAGQSPDMETFSADDLTAVARDRQYLAYYAWKPYLHNPSLARWLHRVGVPVHLIWGERDGYVAPDYGRRLAEKIPGSRLDMVPGAGHYPQIEFLNETAALLNVGPCAVAGG